MNTQILPQSPVVTMSVAYRFGQQDAQAGKTLCPEAIFISRSQQVAYAAGYEAVAGITTVTAQFTGSVIPAPLIVPNLKVNDRERVRRTDSNVARIFSASAAQSNRLARMAEETAAFLGVDSGEIIFA